MPGRRKGDEVMDKKLMHAIFQDLSDVEMRAALCLILGDAQNGVLIDRERLDSIFNTVKQ
jgi:hypothetical protein